MFDRQGFLVWWDGQPQRRENDVEILVEVWHERHAKVVEWGFGGVFCFNRVGRSRLGGEKEGGKKGDALPERTQNDYQMHSKDSILLYKAFSGPRRAQDGCNRVSGGAVTDGTRARKICRDVTGRGSTSEMGRLLCPSVSFCLFPVPR